MYTDEASIEMGERPGHRKVTRLPGEEELPENIEPIFRSGRKSLMVWGAITHNKKGPLIRLETVPAVVDSQGRKKGGGINGERYVSQVLMGPLVDFIDEVEDEFDVRVEVVEDGAPAHRSKVAKAARKEKCITTLVHPPRSPDLNPMEPVWHILKDRVFDIPSSRNSLDGLWAACQQVWDEISLEDIRKHTSKMNERVAAVKKANGYHTSF
jgi:transposase